jgi:acyl-CoA dehydrogenase
MGQAVQPLAGLDGTRQWGALHLDRVTVPAAARIDDGAAPLALEHALAVAGLGLAAEQVGAARGVMDLTLAYIAERVQFGRTIASFQAIKHRCAALEADLAEARALVHGAAASTDPDAFALEVAGLRALAQDLLFRAAQEAIQLHGGVGFTWEYDPHLYFKRAKSDRALLGDPEAHLDAIAAHLLDTDAKA